jgi:CcmD family protein
MTMNRSFQALVFSLVLAGPITALAQPGNGSGTATTAPAAQAAPAEAPKNLPPGFEKVAGAPDSQKIDASRLVIAAYVAIFVGIFGYVILLAKKQAELAKEMTELAARIDKAKK